ncbi:Asp23/Gls24 family envelope stress response protein [Acidiferrimicrobium sp. IK]|uniref:Asp23/Gls24 family envelope stress response protein n=1 Tax=Acidiferrimicrobium sp. IK TaxID=2871700 RepID=UPI0021CB3613|nr:Asp23/Gls24 family envelope stress response protein [Acidiferrimicrobium sp. IK]MCU4186008.1 Asp23/Gls24 family envelope stress response protein [Acidiferrimicrobium sp. IK]
MARTLPDATTSPGLDDPAADGSVTAPAPTSTDIVASEGGKGRTTIAESVVAKIASLAAKEVEGVDTLGGILSGAISGVVGRIRGDEHRTAGVGVEVGERQAAVDLSMTVRYPYPIHETAEAVRENVIDRIEAMTGLDVVEVNIAITDLSFDGTGSPGATGRVE